MAFQVFPHLVSSPLSFSGCIARNHRVASRRGIRLWIVVLCALSVLDVGTANRGRGKLESSRALLTTETQEVSKEVLSAPEQAPSKLDSWHRSLDHRNPTAQVTGVPHGKAPRSTYHHVAMTPDGQMVRVKNGSMSSNDFIQSLEGNATGLQSILEHRKKIPKQVSLNDSQLIEQVSVDNATGLSNKEYLIALGGGTGATIGGTGILALDKSLIRRMKYQDKAVMMMMLIVYFVILGFSASFVYRQAMNNSPVTFYADPRLHDIVVEGRDPEAVLESFACTPKDIQLQVTGFVPVSSAVLGAIEWQGEYYFDSFSFALDLSPWIVREGTAEGSQQGPWNDDLSLTNGIAVDDINELNHYVTRDRNDLAMLEFRKEVAWPNWEELATNIKHRIRQEGFPGIISVHRTDCENVTIYKNTTWANFMHSRTTKLLCALSVIGWAIYLPYMWLRCTRAVVRTRFKVDVPIDAYWQFIADKLTANGFEEDPSSLRSNPRTGQLRQLLSDELRLSGQIGAGFVDPHNGEADQDAGWEEDWQSATTENER